MLLARARTAPHPMEVNTHHALNAWVSVQVLYEDDHMLAVNKPPGLRMAPRHRFEGGSLLNRMLHHLGTSTGGAKPHIVHRLDMDTSGVVVFAKSAAAADALCRQFRERSSRKEYVALCVAAPTVAASASASTAPVPTTFQVDAPIGRSPLGKEYRAVVSDGDASFTEFRTLAVGAWHGTPVYAMHAAPRTGRTHQVQPILMKKHVPSSPSWFAEDRAALVCRSACIWRMWACLSWVICSISQSRCGGRTPRGRRGGRCRILQGTHCTQGS